MGYGKKFEIKCGVDILWKIARYVIDGQAKQGYSKNTAMQVGVGSRYLLLRFQNTPREVHTDSEGALQTYLSLTLPVSSLAFPFVSQ